ncbi:MAG: FkbM family methyltransferase [Thermoanaerobaculia bacterium]
MHSVDGSRNPDFDVAILEGAPAVDGREDVVLYPAGGGIEALWRSRLLDELTVRRFLFHVHAVLAADDSEASEDVELLSAEELSAIAAFETGGAAIGSRQAVHKQFVEQARRTPDAAALQVDDETVTFAQLQRSSATVASALIERGVRAGDAVGVAVAPRYGVVGALGVLRSGATLVPIDVTLPQARLASHVEQAEVRYAIVDEPRRDLVPVENLIAIEQLHFDSGDDFTDVAVSDDSIAYVLFTSGSTGVPKGIQMPHRGLTNVVGWQVARSAQAPRTLQRTSLAFDVGMQEIFSTLCAGGCLVIADEETRADPSKLPDFIAEHAIERLFVPPVSLYQMAAAIDAHPRMLPSLREVYAAGETLQLDAPVVRFFRSVDARLENQYGPTETHVATTFRLDDSPLRWPPRPLIGRPVPGTEVRIVDERGRRVPIGIAGEIIVRGDQVSHSYLGAPPFQHTDGTPAYATGDIGWWTASGDIEFLGRKDRQAKVRGYRIELGEIETALLAQPGVRAAIAATLEDDATSTRVVAWIVPDVGFQGTSMTRKRLLDVLPEYMVPALNGLAILDRLPLTRTGKIDLSALQPPGKDELSPDSYYVPSRNEIESIVADIWRTELGIERVGVHDNFVEIGGHSLVGIRIVSKLNDRFGVSLPLRLLLRGGTVAAVAMRLADVTAAEPPESDLVRTPLPDGRVVVAPSAGEAQYLWEDVFAQHSYGAPVLYPRDGVIVDVGAHIGLFTLYALAAAPCGRVVAIEPVPVLFDALQQNTAAYAQRVAYYAAAAGNCDGAASMTYYPKLSGMSSLTADPEADASLLRRIMRNLLEARVEMGGLLSELEEIVSERLVSRDVHCTVRRLESILDEAAPKRIDVLKVDVQRSEESVLHSVGNAWPRVKQVVVEVHDENGALKRIEDFLQARGFTTSARQQSIHTGTSVRFIVGAR